MDDDVDSSPEGNGSGAIGTPAATTSHSEWPTETNITYVPGMKVKLSAQSCLLRVIFHDGFDNLRKELLFKNAFLNAKAIPPMLRRCLVDAAQRRTFFDGVYNASAACVHQRLLTDVAYEDKVVQLVSSIISGMTLLIIFSATGPHSHHPR